MTTVRLALRPAHQVSYDGTGRRRPSVWPA